MKFTSKAQQAKVMSLMKKKNLKGNPISYEQKGNYQRVGIRPTSAFKTGTIRTTDIGKPKDVLALTGRLKGKKTTAIKTYLIPGKTKM